jgi:hypothetical protein
MVEIDISPSATRASSDGRDLHFARCIIVRRRLEPAFLHFIRSQCSVDRHLQNRRSLSGAQSGEENDRSVGKL